ncbi:MAG: HEAT repeat domain-containing protein [Planctomycetes bacterium]|nr:HEAT repeat domain-containing protein [Planctomycetota bacterium]
MRLRRLARSMGRLPWLKSSPNGETENNSPRAVWTLGWLGDRRAIAPLARALKDPLPGLRAKAAWALGKMGVTARCTRTGCTPS